MQNPTGKITLTDTQIKICKELKGKITDEQLSKKINVPIGKLKFNLIKLNLTKKRRNNVPIGKGFFCWDKFKQTDLIFKQ